jgi:hypothetical protein
MTLISADNKELLQTWYQLDDHAQQVATDCSLLPAIFQDLRFGIKLIF